MLMREMHPTRQTARSHMDRDMMNYVAIRKDRFRWQERSQLNEIDLEDHGRPQRYPLKVSGSS